MTVMVIICTPIYLVGFLLGLLIKPALTGIEDGGEMAGDLIGKVVKWGRK